MRTGPDPNPNPNGRLCLHHSDLEQIAATLGAVYDDRLGLYYVSNCQDTSSYPSLTFTIAGHQFTLEVR